MAMMNDQDQPAQVAVRLKEAAKPSGFGRVDANGWSFCYSVPSPALPGLYGFSAQLEPKGRGSVEEDWRYLGEVAFQIGVPEREGCSLFTDVGEADPNSVLKWMWVDSSEVIG
jgi:hypothetical protein